MDGCRTCWISNGRQVALREDMFRYVRRAAAKLNRHMGMSIRHTHLYRLSRPKGWSPAAESGGLKWELLAPPQVGRLEGVGWFDLDECLQRFERGDRCYVVSIDGRVAHYSWVQRSGSHPISEAGVSVRVEDGAFWIYHCRTAEWARGRGIYPATLAKIVNDCFAEGYCTAWIYTAKSNVASQKGIVRAGFGLVTTLRSLRMGSQYLPVGDSERALVEVLRSEARAIPERRRDPVPGFVSPPFVDRRLSPRLDRETPQIAMTGEVRAPAAESERPHHRSERRSSAEPVG